ncbi:hypothetical protein [Sulfurimonas sp. HSL-1716]|uniref:hypothetical protein n=1 Tax=Hydrocurvibacter sulfurireducens TaxID=3131937 RepID=UPI0031FA2CBC
MKNKFRKIYVIDSFYYFHSISDQYQLKDDLVLTYDLRLKKEIESIGGSAFYIDHLSDSDTMEMNNMIVYKFLKNWYNDPKGNDIFSYKNVSFGISFRLEILNDCLTYIRLHLSLSKIKDMQFEQLFIISDTDRISSVLDALAVSYTIIEHETNNQNSFYFPIDKWLEERTQPKGFRKVLHQLKQTVTLIHAKSMLFMDKMIFTADKKSIFVEEYYPTRSIIKKLKSDNKINVVQSSFSRTSSLKENLLSRIIPVSVFVKEYKKIKDDLLENFKKQRYYQLVLSNGHNVSKQIYKIIEAKLEKSCIEKLKIIDDVIYYIDRHPLNMNILISNIGKVSILVDCVCKSRNIPSYFIANGLLLGKYGDEGKYATMINAYSQSVKDNYFEGMDNVVAIGDPRMDMYSSMKKNSIDRTNPTVTIGASGFGVSSLNSYVATEFDFVYDLLAAFQKIKDNKTEVNINIKVRSNGYIKQYQDFAAQYFPNLAVSVYDSISMNEILLKTDLYISIHSQTLFEASCMGIPVIYYKNDTEVFTPPFDNHSELVTINNVDDMVQAFYDFKNKHERYEPFLDRKVMEEYIGPLDGKNLKRNIDFIYKLLENDITRE